MKSIAMAGTYSFGFFTLQRILYVGCSLDGAEALSHASSSRGAPLSFMTVSQVLDSGHESLNFGGACTMKLQTSCVPHSRMHFFSQDPEQKGLGITVTAVETKLAT